VSSEATPHGTDHATDGGQSTAREWTMSSHSSGIAMWSIAMNDVLYSG